MIAVDINFIIPLYRKLKQQILPKIRINISQVVRHRDHIFNKSHSIRLNVNKATAFLKKYPSEKVIKSKKKLVEARLIFKKSTYIHAKQKGLFIVYTLLVFPNSSSVYCLY